jgi:hypothetical protein
LVIRATGTKYVAGWYRLGAPGSSRLFVNAGVGSAAIRWRVGKRAMPEVAVIDLV